MKDPNARMAVTRLVSATRDAKQLSAKLDSLEGLLFYARFAFMLETVAAEAQGKMSTFERSTLNDVNSEVNEIHAMFAERRQWVARAESETYVEKVTSLGAEVRENGRVVSSLVESGARRLLPRKG